MRYDIFAIKNNMKWTHSYSKYVQNFRIKQKTLLILFFCTSALVKCERYPIYALILIVDNPLCESFGLKIV